VAPETAGCPVHPDRTPLYGPDFSADPGRVYARMRRHGSVAPVELAPGVPATLVLGYGAALDVLRDPGGFPKDSRRWQQRVPADCPVLPLMMYRPNCMYTDGEVHARLRQAVTDSLARIDPVDLRRHVERSADMLIARIGPLGEADLLREFATPLPLLVFNGLFGCPPELGERLAAGVQGIFDGVDAEKANAQLVQCTTELVALKRRQPGSDVASWLLAHPARLSDEEAMHQLLVLMGAGTEPEKNLIANGIRLLLSDHRFGGHLGGGTTSVEDALDEILWRDPPVANFAFHYPVESRDFEGVRLPADEPVVISFAAANTDPTMVSDHQAGNRAHLAWSAGPHACPATSQARLIAAVAIERLLDGLPEMELAVPAHELTWRPGPFHRALTALPVRFPPVAARPAATFPQRPLGRGDGDRLQHVHRQRAAQAAPPPAARPFAEPEPASPSRWARLTRWWRGR
jgi:cytochrome P450